MSEENPTMAEMIAKEEAPMRDAIDKAFAIYESGGSQGLMMALVMRILKGQANPGAVAQIISARMADHVAKRKAELMNLFTTPAASVPPPRE